MTEKAFENGGFNYSAFVDDGSSDGSGWTQSNQLEEPSAGLGPRREASESDARTESALTLISNPADNASGTSTTSCDIASQS